MTTSTKKMFIGALGVASMTLCGNVLASPSAHADGLTFQVTNYDDDATTGVFLRNSANADDKTGTLLGYGTNIQLNCYLAGSAVGPNNNSRWDQVTVQDGPNAGATGYLSEHWINTPVAGASGEAACSGGSSSSAGQGAISWARGYLGQDYMAGFCLGFVMDAYSAAGLDIGGADTAALYWSQNPKGYPSGTDTNPPVGALVFWGVTSNNDAGHVGIYEGNDTVISTQSWPAGAGGDVVHEFSLSGRNAAGYPYLGWINPS